MFPPFSSVQSRTHSTAIHSISGQTMGRDTGERLLPRHAMWPPPGRNSKGEWVEKVVEFSGPVQRTYLGCCRRRDRTKIQHSVNTAKMQENPAFCCSGYWEAEKFHVCPVKRGTCKMRVNTAEVPENPAFCCSGHSEAKQTYFKTTEPWNLLLLQGFDTVDCRVDCIVDCHFALICGTL